MDGWPLYLKERLVGERGEAAVADDHMVEYLDAYEVGGLAEALGTCTQFG
jgi:hypothetical protein